uniref:WBP2 N-terminal like n=1 Tax=Oryzias sinensis TaxID=183150 RepID=A0A8C7Z3N6_9TELE
MALNRNHSPNGGALINNGESVVRQCKNVELSFSDVTSKTDILKGTKKGSIYLTPYRLVFVSSNPKDCLGSAMFPYYLMKGCSLEQPVFGANYIKGTVRAEPGGMGYWEGQATFKMSFPSGGAIEVGQHLFKLATNASQAPPAQNGAASYGYPAPGMMNGYGPSPPAPNGYPYPPPPQQNGFYQAPPCCSWQCGILLCTTPSLFLTILRLLPRTGNPKAAEAAGSAYYNPNNPHSVYMPTERPPPYAPHPDSEKKSN